MRASRGGNGKLAQTAAFFGNAAVAVDSAEFAEQCLCFSEGGTRRRIEEGEFFRRRAPGGKIEREGGEIGGENFRPRECVQRRCLRLVPEPVADAGLDAAGAAAALIGGSA